MSRREARYGQQIKLNLVKGQSPVGWNLKSRPVRFSRVQNACEWNFFAELFMDLPETGFPSRHPEIPAARDVSLGHGARSPSFSCFRRGFAIGRHHVQSLIQDYVSWRGREMQLPLNFYDVRGDLSRNTWHVGFRKHILRWQTLWIRAKPKSPLTLGDCPLECNKNGLSVPPICT